MSRHRPVHPATASASVALAIGALLIVAASGALGGNGRTGAALPSSGPGTPGVSSPAPVDDASDGIDRVDLVNEPGVPSWAVVWDESETLGDARSGRPADGASVADNEIAVVHVDDDTIRLTWSDLPIESQARVTIHLAPDGTFDIRVVRTRPSAPTDATATDRVLELDFNVAVPIEDLGVSLVDSLDNDG